MKTDNYKRGSLYWATMPNTDSTISIQMGVRPVLILSNDLNNKHSQNVIVLPCSSKIYKKGPRYPFHIFVRDILKKDSIILAEQIAVLAKKSLIGGPITTLSENDMEKVNEAVKLQLGLN